MGPQKTFKKYKNQHTKTLTLEWKSEGVASDESTDDKGDKLACENGMKIRVVDLRERVDVNQ